MLYDSCGGEGSGRRREGNLHGPTYIGSRDDRSGFHNLGSQQEIWTLLGVSYECTDRVCSTNPFGWNESSARYYAIKRGKRSVLPVEGHVRPRLRRRHVIRKRLLPIRAVRQGAVAASAAAAAGMKRSRETAFIEADAVPLSQ